MDAQYYRDLIRPVFAGRKWIIAAGVLVGTTPIVRLLRQLGAEPPFVLCGQIGTGEPPSDEDIAGWMSLDVHASSMIQEIRSIEHAFDDLPAPARGALDRFDPDRQAVVLGTPFARSPEVAGRRRYTWRPPSWQGLEDKIIADEIWDEARVERAPMRIARVDAQDLREASTTLDEGAGVVWAGDAREGHNGGGEYVRWVGDADDAREAIDFFSRHCDVVRVMPFFEGIACSIHGIVFESETVAFRPIEMVTLRGTQPPRLRYCGCAGFWDPAAEEREYMRDVARRVGSTLRRRVDYRGAFTVDGVMSEHGFRPTELNPRYGAGLGVLSRSNPDLPLHLVDQCILAREPFDFRPSDLEALVVEGADARRNGGAWTVLRTTITENDERPVVFGDGTCRVASAGEGKHGDLIVGPSGIGGFVRYNAEPDHTPAGPSVAPRAVAAFALADAEFATSLGALEPPRPVR